MEPSDISLYNKTKKNIYKKYPKHSAYRSGLLVKSYKKAFSIKYKNTKKSPYKGKYTRKKGLRRWFDEEWVNQRGEVGYKYKNDIYRPKIRITDDTPITHNELTKKEIKNARTKKYKTGRVNRFKKSKKNNNLKGGVKVNKTRKKKTRFSDFPEFRPNLTPRQIFKLGSFGGTYWRPIYSKVTGKNYKNKHLNYPKSWWKGISNNNLTRKWEDYDTNINKYGVKVGTTLEFWEEKNWIKKYHPYGWVQWYCDFYNGKRSPDDERQVKRWVQTAGPNSRFRKALINLIKKNKAKYNDFNISPKIRQTLQHWGYVLTERDCK